MLQVLPGPGCAGRSLLQLGGHWHGLRCYSSGQACPDGYCFPSCSIHSSPCPDFLVPVHLTFRLQICLGRRGLYDSISQGLVEEGKAKLVSCSL